ncbi:MAG: multiheme c-type cytochrome, partial [Nitrospinaceae bacterium]
SRKLPVFANPSPLAVEAAHPPLAVGAVYTPRAKLLGLGSMVFTKSFWLGAAAAAAWLSGAVSLAGAEPPPAAPAQAPPAKLYADIKINPNGLTPSHVCGKCHQDIYRAWKNSLHADSFSNPVFQAAFMEAHFQRGESVREKCLPCHAPVAILYRDLQLSSPLSREGINCDFCHSISEVLPDPTGPRHRFEFGRVKQGPLDGVESPVHKTRYNPLYERSEFCGGCHELKTAEGLKIIETFSEWKASPYPAKGLHCQSCHMTKIPGKIVPAEVKPTAKEVVSSHDIASGHALSRREKSLQLTIAKVERYKNRITVHVALTNQGAGHRIPTGLPTKKMVLQVTLQSREGQTRHVQQKVYQKLLAGADGRIIHNDADLMLGSNLQLISDNRIGPLETRRESFIFFAPAGEPYEVTAAVYFRHNPKILQTVPINIKMREVRTAISGGETP